MTKLRLFFLLLVALPFILNAQTGAGDTQQYDSIMAIMKNKSVPFMDKYYMTGDIAYLSRDHQIKVVKHLLPEAKQMADKSIITRLYSLISLFNTQQSLLNEAKNYLDSAFIYKGKFENNNIAGMMHYVAGTYYMTVTDFVQAHKQYYEAIDFFNRNAQKPGILTDIYYNLSVIYILWQDEKGLQELIGEMKDSPVEFPFQQILKLTVQAQYYYIHYTNAKDVAYLDSAAMCNDHAFDVYNTTANPYDVGYQVADNYLHQALIYCYMNKADEAKTYFEIGQKLMNPEKLTTDSQVLFISGMIFYKMKDYHRAEEKLKVGLNMLTELSEEQQINYDALIISIYSALAKVYEEQGRYEEAVNAQHEIIVFSNRLFREDSQKAIGNLRVKYNLDQAEYSVKQLTVLNEQSKQINKLAAGMVVLALVSICLLVIRYRSRQKLNAHQLQIARLKQQESDLMIELQKTKLEEKEKEFEAMVGEAHQRRVQSYLEGLEVERNRLARELHDNVSNELVAIRLKIEAEQSSREDIVNTLSLLHSEVRAISHDLMPPVFKYATLPEILEDYVYQHNKQDKTQLTLLLNPDEDWNNIPQRQGLEIYRIIQEATGNALKHAEATEIKMILSKREDKMRITIADNGKGFDTNRKSLGIGMNIIRERVDNLNGHLTINSEPGKGTEVIVEC